MRRSSPRRWIARLLALIGLVIAAAFVASLAPKSGEAWRQQRWIAATGWSVAVVGWSINAGSLLHWLWRRWWKAWFE